LPTDLAPQDSDSFEERNQSVISAFSPNYSGFRKEMEMEMETRLQQEILPGTGWLSYRLLPQLRPHQFDRRLLSK
jgi:hypothetical protein